MILVKRFISYVLPCVLLGCVTGVASAQEPPAIRFSVSSFEVTGPNPIDKRSTNVILEPFKGEFDGLDGLIGAVDALQEALNNRGYTFYRVSLPPQTLESGRVILAIDTVEFGEVKIEGSSISGSIKVFASPLQQLERKQRQHQQPELLRPGRQG